MSDRITQRPPYDDQREPHVTLLPAANPCQKLSLTLFFAGAAGVASVSPENPSVPRHIKRICR